MARTDRYADPQYAKNEYYKERKKSKKKKKKGCLLAIIKILLILVLVCGLAGGVYAAVTISQAPEINPKTMYDSINLSTSRRSVINNNLTSEQRVAYYGISCRTYHYAHPVVEVRRILLPLNHLLEPVINGGV